MNYYNTDVWEFLHKYNINIISNADLINTHDFRKQVAEVRNYSNFLCKNCNETLLEIIYEYLLVCNELVIKKALE